MPGKEKPRSDTRMVRRPKRLDEKRFLQIEVDTKETVAADHVVDYEETISLDGFLEMQLKIQLRN